MAHKLLLADDSITIQKVVELTLSEEGFEVTAVGDGEAAYETAKDLDPDIILADVFMPKLDGYELCRKLKSDPALSGIPVLLLYGTFEDFDEMKAAQVGASDSLTKPFESVDLIDKVKALAGARQAGGAPTMPTVEEAVSVEAEPIEEAVMEAEPEMLEPEGGTEADDLWNVVGMGEERQPLSDATAVLTEEELWKRANLTQDEAPPTAAPPPEAPMAGEGMLWDEEPAQAAEPVEDVEVMEAEGEAFGAEPFEETEPMYGAEPLDEEPVAEDRTAILNMDDLQASVRSAPQPEPEPEPYPVYEPEPVAEAVPEPAPIELAQVDESVEITTFDSLQDATVGEGYSRPEPAFAPAAAAAAPVSGDIRDQVMQAAGDIIRDKLKEALMGMSREMIEQIAWEVIPDLAEEIINREIQKMKAGT